MQHVLQQYKIANTQYNLRFGSKRMKTYIDVLIVSEYEDKKDFIEILKEFGNHAAAWAYLEEQSKDYASQTGEPSCLILRNGNKFSPAIAITNKRGNTFYIANIVPKESWRMSMTEYNEIVSEFAQDFKEYIRKHRVKAAIKTTKEEIGLKEIITGKITRQLFERYLSLHPTSYHPLDIERLDAFICGVSRYSRQHIDLDLLKGWLIEEEGWSEKDAWWCVERIETGLAVLRVNKRF
jgi:hypothetical protein